MRAPPRLGTEVPCPHMRKALAYGVLVTSIRSPQLKEPIPPPRRVPSHSSAMYIAAISCARITPDLISIATHSPHLLPPSSPCLCPRLVCSFRHCGCHSTNYSDASPHNNGVRIKPFLCSEPNLRIKLRNGSDNHRQCSKDR